jgi:hypothetical protein
MANRMRSEVKERYWRGQVSGWQSSGLGIRAYCQQQQLSEANFHAWRRELARRDQLTPPASATATPSVNDTSVTKPQTSSSLTWMPVTLTEPVAPVIEVQLPCGVQLRISCGLESLETLLSALQRSVA